MGFDKTSPGGGAEIYTRLENGKALLEFSFYLEEAAELPDLFVEVVLRDGQGNCVMNFVCPASLEEPVRGLLLHPHLWNGVEDPYLYELEADLVRGPGDHPRILDRLRRLVPLCTFQRAPEGRWLLNGSAFPLRAVSYRLPAKEPGKSPREIRVLQDLKGMRDMGANAVCLERGSLDPGFYELCCKYGLALFGPAAGRAAAGCGAPASWEELWKESGRAADRYYYYRALWSAAPFVYLCKDSLKRQENGLYQVTAYSNRKKAALYVEGRLFEFQTGAPEFVFVDVEIRHFPAVLTVEADMLCMSVTVFGGRVCGGPISSSFLGKKEV